MTSLLRFHRIQVLLGGVMGAMVGAFTTLFIAALIFSGDPVQIMANPKLSVVARNGVLEASYTFFRSGDCNSPAATWLWRWADGDGLLNGVRYFVPIANTTITLSDPSPLLQRVIVARELPRTVTPGQWFLRIKYLDYCRFLAPFLGPTTRQIEDIPVAIGPDDLVTTSQ